MRTYATILCLLLAVPAYAVDTLRVTTPDPVTESWRWTEFNRSSGIAGNTRDVYVDREGELIDQPQAGRLCGDDLDVLDRDGTHGD